MSSERSIGGLSCGEVLALLPDFVDGTLEESTLVKLRAHVGACDACDRFGAAYAATIRALRVSATEQALDEAQIATILAKVG